MIWNPQELTAYILKQELANVVAKPLLKIEEYWVWVQEIMIAFINRQLARVQTHASILSAKHPRQLSYLQQGTAFVVRVIIELEFSLKTTIRSLTISMEKPEEMQWEWRPRPIQLLFLSD